MQIVDAQDKTFGKIHLEIGPANVRRGMLRSILIGRSDEYLKEHPAQPDDIEGSAETFLRGFLYPCLVAGVIRQSGFDHWPIDYDEFVQMDETTERPWEEATFSENPSWKILPEIDVKKVTSSSLELLTTPAETSPVTSQT